MAEVKALRLAKAGATYNVSQDHILEALKKAKFVLTGGPNEKLTPEMIAVLDKEFGADKSIKQQADNTAIIDKTKKETVEAKEDNIATHKKEKEEKEILITNNIAHKEKEKPDEVITAKKQTLEGPKIVGKLEPEEKPKKTTKKKEEVVEPVVEEKVEEVKPVKKKQEPEPEVEQKIETKYQTLEGTKEVGKIDLSQFAPKPKKKEEPKKDVPAGEKKPRERKLVKKKERAPLSGDQYYDKKVENFQRKRDGSTGFKKPDPTAQPAEITEKQIEDKIRATMAKIQAQTSKSDRSKLRRGKREAQQEKLEAQQEGVQHNKLQVAEFISVAELAALMNMAPVQIISTCMQLGVIVSINQRLDATIIELVTQEHGWEVEFISAADQTAFKEEEPDKPEDLHSRAPIVTIMGHVDHGKTSLLDYIRKPNVEIG